MEGDILEIMWLLVIYLKVILKSLVYLGKDRIERVFKR